MSNSALDTWREKLEHLQREEAICSDPNQLFTIKQRIEEAESKIAELESNPSSQDEATATADAEPARNPAYFLGAILIVVGVIGLFAILGKLNTISGLFTTTSEATVEEKLSSLEEAEKTGAEVDTEKLEQELEQYRRIEKLFAIYSFVAWVPPNGHEATVTENDAFGDGTTFTLSCSGGDSEEMGYLIHKFATPVTTYVPRAGVEVDTTLLVNNSDFWYAFDWPSIFGVEMGVQVNYEPSLSRLAEDIESKDLDGAGPIPTYGVQISGYSPSGDSIGFVVRAGVVIWHDNGSVSIDDSDVEIYFSDGEMITGSQLVDSIRLMLRELGLNEQNLTSAAIAVQTDLLKRTPKGVGAVFNAIPAESPVGRILDSL